MSIWCACGKWEQELSGSLVCGVYVCFSFCMPFKYTHTHNTYNDTSDSVILFPTTPHRWHFRPFMWHRRHHSFSLRPYTFVFTAHKPPILLVSTPYTIFAPLRHTCSCCSTCCFLWRIMKRSRCESSTPWILFQHSRLLY